MKPTSPSERKSETVPPLRQGIDRRQFVQSLGLGAGMAMLPSFGYAAGATSRDGLHPDHHVPVDKGLSKEWVSSLYERGGSTWFSGDDLKTIGMPIGGVAAGQLYLTGDGRLIYWGIFNTTQDTGPGGINYKVGRTADQLAYRSKGFVPAPNIAQGAVLRTTSGGKTQTRTLDSEGFSSVKFCGEYPIAKVDFADADSDVAVSLEACSPFIPLNAADSGLPVTILRYTLTNKGEARTEATISSWLENATLYDGAGQFVGQAERRNRVRRDDAFTAVIGSVEELEHTEEPVEPPVVFADFEAIGYGDWKVEGEAFGKRPTKGPLPHQNVVAGHQGEGLANSFVGGDDARGKLTSPEFTIEKPWIGFLIGGGAFPTTTCINLIVQDEVVRTATGANSELLSVQNWNVSDFVGQQARIEIVDAVGGPWGHVNVDQIEFRDGPMAERSAPLRRRPDFGGMALALLGDGDGDATASVDIGREDFAAVAADRSGDGTSDARRSLDARLVGAVGTSFELAPGESATATFVVAWRMPNLYNAGKWVGNAYATRFRSVLDVVRYVADDFDRLVGTTKQWHDTFYDTTLPYWLLDRIGSTLSNLATNTCQWWANGRFWAWEGVGSCHGTCGHVWNYEHAMARLFPELERSVRSMQDFEPEAGFNAETGSIGFRGEGWPQWAGDSQAGYVLKAYREHQCAPDDSFLMQFWPRIRKAMEFLIAEDSNADGLLEGRQHQTYDQDYYGANTMVGSLYLAALRAAEEMAREVGDKDFAAQCAKIFASGSKITEERLFNGEYFVQDVDVQKHPHWQYADGCLADQLFGQGWAHQLGLGYVYSKETVRKALESIWRYCWTPDIDAQNKRHAPERWFAFPGEAGLLTCTWPKSKRPGPPATRYCDEVWTGIEYQVANHMAWEGMVTEALALCRAAHDRYHPSKRNPFNEIECGDHYARSLASWGLITSLSGFEHHNSKGTLGFAPRIEAGNFRSVFTTAEGWGTYEQKRSEGEISAEVQVASGEVHLTTLRLAISEGTLPAKAEVAVGGNTMELAVTDTRDGQIELRFVDEAIVSSGEKLAVRVRIA
ncbi:GH116 family glycosyl hydrolase [Botrimarina mediterranea]|nr:GH116 family glycosyl hydrolase [Botrimarina mediterranea]